jgi:hypothetical protein
MQSVVSQQRQVASLESDERLMEALAARRSELQHAQKEASSQPQGWMTTARSSFFLVSEQPLLGLLQNELDQVEQELRILCKRIMSETKEQQQE